jgi:hypothetical protein
MVVNERPWAATCTRSSSTDGISPASHARQRLGQGLELGDLVGLLGKAGLLLGEPVVLLGQLGGLLGYADVLLG